METNSTDGKEMKTLKEKAVSDKTMENNYWSEQEKLNPKKGGGAHCAPPSTFTQFFGINAIVTDAHSICKFLNIR